MHERVPKSELVAQEAVITVELVEGKSGFAGEGMFSRYADGEYFVQVWNIKKSVVGAGEGQDSERAVVGCQRRHYLWRIADTGREGVLRKTCGKLW